MIREQGRELFNTQKLNEYKAMVSERELNIIVSYIIVAGFCDKASEGRSENAFRRLILLTA